jgi:hypothetical protein
MTCVLCHPIRSVSHAALLTQALDYLEATYGRGYEEEPEPLEGSIGSVASIRAKAHGCYLKEVRESSDIFMAESEANRAALKAAQKVGGEAYKAQRVVYQAEVVAQKKRMKERNLRSYYGRLRPKEDLVR